MSLKAGIRQTHREIIRRYKTSADFYLTAKGKVLSPNATLLDLGLLNGDTIQLNYRLKGGAQPRMNLEGEEDLLDMLELKEDRYLTRYNPDSGAIFNLGDPDRLLTSILPFLEMTATLKIRHSGLIKGPLDWSNWEYTSAMAKALATSTLADHIITIKADQHETEVVLMDPILARHLLASQDRIEVEKPKKMLLPFFRNAPPMSPNLERYGVTITHG